MRVAQNFGELVIEGARLHQLVDVIVGHGILLVLWRSGGLKHPYGTIPAVTSFRIMARWGREGDAHFGNANFVTTTRPSDWRVPFADTPAGDRITPARCSRWKRRCVGPRGSVCKLVFCRSDLLN